MNDRDTYPLSILAGGHRRADVSKPCGLPLTEDVDGQRGRKKVNGVEGGAGYTVGDRERPTRKRKTASSRRRTGDDDHQALKRGNASAGQYRSRLVVAAVLLRLPQTNRIHTHVQIAFVVDHAAIKRSFRRQPSTSANRIGRSLGSLARTNVYIAQQSLPAKRVVGSGTSMTRVITSSCLFISASLRSSESVGRGSRFASKGASAVVIASWTSVTPDRSLRALQVDAHNLGASPFVAPLDAFAREEMD
uniref:Uncharacterized protein n=1 Tax=Plectus sambesii TaxID=2011161 RepID=A0A914W1C8_9BILA